MNAYIYSTVGRDVGLLVSLFLKKCDKDVTELPAPLGSEAHDCPKNDYLSSVVLSTTASDRPAFIQKRSARPPMCGSFGPLWAPGTGTMSTSLFRKQRAQSSLQIVSHASPAGRTLGSEFPGHSSA